MNKVAQLFKPVDEHDETKEVWGAKQRILRIAEDKGLYVRHVESGLVVDGSFFHNDKLYEVDENLTIPVTKPPAAALNPGVPPKSVKPTKPAPPPVKTVP